MREGLLLPCLSCVCTCKQVVLPNSTWDFNPDLLFAFRSRVGRGVRETEGWASDAGVTGWSRASGVEVRQGSPRGREAESG